MPVYDIGADIAWFNEHVHDLMAKYGGKMLAIRDGAILAVGTTLADVAGKAGRPLGEYLIRRCVEGAGAHTVRVHTPRAASV